MAGSVNTKVKKVNFPLSVFSTLNGVKPAKVSNNVLNGMKNYYNGVPKKVRSTNIKAYRERVDRLYKSLNGIKPIDCDVNNIVYLNNFLEKGISIKSNVMSLKQLWVEFRLIYNEVVKNMEKEETKMKENLDDKKIQEDALDSFVLNNFDEIFNKLSKDIDGINGYLNDFVEMKKYVSISKKEQEETKKLLDEDKINFQRYVDEETKKIKKEQEDFEYMKKAQELIILKSKEELKNNFKKLEELTRKFNERIADIRDE